MTMMTPVRFGRVFGLQGSKEEIASAKQLVETKASQKGYDIRFYDPVDFRTYIFTDKDAKDFTRREKPHLTAVDTQQKLCDEVKAELAKHTAGKKKAAPAATPPDPAELARLIKALLTHKDSPKTNPATKARNAWYGFLNKTTMGFVSTGLMSATTFIDKLSAGRIQLKDRSH